MTERMIKVVQQKALSINNIRKVPAPKKVAGTFSNSLIHSTYRCTKISPCHSERSEESMNV